MAEPFLDLDERRRLVQRVAGLYDFTDLGPRGRRVFLQSAGLGRFVPGIDLSGDARTVAGDLVGRLERFGRLPERPAYHALGALVGALLDVPELADDAAAEVAALVVRYSLVADDAYVGGLRRRYGIAEPMVREPAPEAWTPRTGAAVGGSPDFEPKIEDAAGLEAILHSEDNFLDLNLLRGALYCGQAVGRVETPAGTPQGTGFLIGPDLLLTNQHVLPERGMLEETVVRFGFLADAAGVPSEGAVVAAATTLYEVSSAAELDFALIRLAEAPLGALEPPADDDASIETLLARGLHRGYLTLAPRLLKIGARVNILQHPDGDPLKVVLTQNYVVHRTETRVQYVADTMEGSSGSPVLSSRWEVVGLHHSGMPYPAEPADGKRKWKARFRANEGIPMRAILADLHERGLDRYLPKS